MKNNKGITLIALVVIIVLIIIMSTLAIYTGANSLKLIQIQKYKAQMQAIQSAVDEFYEEYENTYEKNKDVFENNSTNTYDEADKINFYVSYIYYYNTTSDTDKMTLNNYYNYIYGYETEKHLNELQNTYQNETNNWWNSIAQNYGIAYDEGDVQKQYYYLSKAEVEDILGVKNIDISDNFIINFQKRYVFSETPLNIDKKGGEAVDIYCLYELNEEEQIIEFKADNSGGTLKIEVVEKTKNYQKIKISTLKGVETKIKQIYYEIEGQETRSSIEATGGTKLPIVESAKNLFEEITGLGTNEVYIKIKQDGNYKFTAEDFFGGYYSNGENYTSIKLHEPPVLENDMVPFIAVSETEGIVYSEDTCSDISQWYDYSSSGNNPKKYATVVISNDTNEDYKNKKGDKFTFDSDYTVKVWIPSSMKGLADYYYDYNFTNKTGIWVEAKWNSISKAWEPLGWTISSITINNKNSFTINTVGTSDSSETYYYTCHYKDGRENYSDNGISKNITLENEKELKDGDKIEVYAISSNGGKTRKLSKEVKLSDGSSSGGTTETPTISSVEISADRKSIQTFVEGSQAGLTYVYEINGQSKGITSSNTYYNNGTALEIGTQIKVTVSNAKGDSDTKIFVENLIADGGFENSGWNATNGTIEYLNKEKHSGLYSLKFTTSSDDSYINAVKTYNFKKTHKYYASIYVKPISINGGTRLQFYMTRSEPGSNTINTSLSTDKWTKFSEILSSEMSSNWNSNLKDNENYNFFVDWDNNNGNVVYFDDLILVDLTATFGSGKEPDKTWCDDNLDYGITAVLAPE